MLKLIYKLKPFDRRRHPRYLPYSAIEGVCSYTDSEKIVICPFGIVDISRGGLKILIGQNKIFPKKQVQLTFPLSVGLQDVCLNGQIVRTYRRKGDDHYYSALRFTDKDAPEIMRLLDFVLNRLVSP